MDVVRCFAEICHPARAKTMASCIRLHMENGEFDLDALVEQMQKDHYEYRNTPKKRLKMKTQKMLNVFKEHGIINYKSVPVKDYDFRSKHIYFFTEKYQ